MKVAIKTVKKIVLEVPKAEMDQKGFDNIWDEIRVKYPEGFYDLYTIESPSDDVVFFELTPKPQAV